jgi:transcriptional regulator with XRE-family HTH domain
MKAKRNEALRELRKIIGLSQGEFAALIGSSKDAVASWEIGRSRLSPPFERRIALATGVDEAALRRGRGPLTTYIPFGGHPPFTAEAFERHRKTYWGRSDEAAARQYHKHCGDALGLLLLAAAQPGRGKQPTRLPAVVDSFVQWCEQTRKDFRLEAGVDAQLAQRKGRVVINHTYGQWRAMEKTDPAACRFMGFKDNPEKGDEESLRLEAEPVPNWWPGRPMWLSRDQTVI